MTQEEKEHETVQCSTVQKAIEEVNKGRRFITSCRRVNGRRESVRYPIVGVARKGNIVTYTLGEGKIIK